MDLNEQGCSVKTEKDVFPDERMGCRSETERVTQFKSIKIQCV